MKHNYTSAQAFKQAYREQLIAGTEFAGVNAAQPLHAGRGLNEKKPIAYQPTFWYGLMIVVMTYLGLMSLANFNVLGHAAHDSFTLMALSWRQGSLSLINGENYPYLELAIHNGQYFVSFPSVPALIMLPFTFIFGENTPNTLITFMVCGDKKTYCV
ncbi:hypothetical protein [Ruminococcus sp.]|uniref:hypothetical protein n=1 Tax=Ruminococcus sp. TaxID=41978 RepID=UPI003AB59CBE